MSKIGNNEKCYCGSELKYKKCCKNIVSTVLPPMNVQQAIARDIIFERNSHIKEPHCKVCGDKDDLVDMKVSQGPMKIVETLTLCKECINIQKTMRNNYFRN